MVSSFDSGGCEPARQVARGGVLDYVSALTTRTAMKISRAMTKMVAMTTGIPRNTSAVTMSHFGSVRMNQRPRGDAFGNASAIHSPDFPASAHADLSHRIRRTGLSGLSILATQSATNLDQYGNNREPADRRDPHV